MMHYLINEVFNDDTKFRIFHLDTTITFQESLDYMEEIIDLYDLRDKFDFVKSKVPFFTEMERVKWWPTIQHLWCRNFLKGKPMKRYYKKMYRGPRKKLIVHLGVSGHDSPQRWKLYVGKSEKQRTKKFGYAYITENYPIVDWTDFKKQAYMKKHNIPINPCYKKYGVSGCYICPFYHLPYYKKLKAVNPDLFWKLYEYEKMTGRKISPEHSLHSLATMVPLTEFEEFEAPIMNETIKRIPT